MPNKKEKRLSDGAHRALPGADHLPVPNFKGKKGKWIAPIGQDAVMEITPEEMEILSRDGFLEIDEPERGWVKMWMPKEPWSPELKGRKGEIQVLRSGTAFRRKTSDYQ